jgi:DNA gyrase/topoisomerase IV subunit A
VTQVDKRDLIAQEDVYVVATRDGYLKRSSIKSWKGSGGQNGARPGIKAGDASSTIALPMPPPITC